MGARLKQLLAQGKLTRVFGLGQLCHPKLVEIVGLQGGYDAVWLDQEHAGLTVEQIEQATCAAPARPRRSCAGPSSIPKACAASTAAASMAGMARFLSAITCAGPMRRRS